MRWRALLLGLLLCPLAGCLNDRPARSTSFIDRFRGMGGPSGADAVFIEYAVIERPAGSSAINRDVWANIDEQLLTAEKRALLSENGLRVGVVGGMLPAELEAMIANPKSAIGHRQRRLYANNPAVLTVNGPVPQVECQLREALDLPPTTQKFEQAKFSIGITPTLRSFKDRGDCVVLKCVPEIEHQDKKNWLPTGAAGPAWLNGKPADRIEALGWEVTLSPREFLIIGTHYGRSGWIGNLIFGGEQANEKVQRLLIVRAGRLATADTTSQPAPATAAKDGIVPIAAQASVSLARGQRPQ